MMKKWAGAAVIYLVVILAAYNIYTVFKNSDTTLPSEPINEHSSHNDKDHLPVNEEDEVKVDLSVSGNKLTIHLVDQDNHAIEELDINHEKLLHLIVVDNQLEQYYHVHPDQIDVGIFQTTLDLEDGSYVAYVDVKPTNLSYQVRPLRFTIGGFDADQREDDGSLELAPDKQLVQSVQNYSVELEPSKLKVGELITLQFELPETVIPEPYLGALGHVVILDETAENFIHVHPTSNQETTFETVFNQPGIYKIWAEFKLDGEVLIFPYVVEVEK